MLPGVSEPEPFLTNRFRWVSLSIKLNEVDTVVLLVHVARPPRSCSQPICSWMVLEGFPPVH